MLLSYESCPKGKQLTLNPRQDHMKNNISYLLWLYVLQLGFIITITMICYFSCESCPKGKQLTLNPRQVHMKITYHIYCELFSHIDFIMCIISLNHTK